MDPRGCHMLPQLWGSMGRPGSNMAPGSRHHLISSRFHQLVRRSGGSFSRAWLSSLASAIQELWGTMVLDIEARHSWGHGL